MTNDANRDPLTGAPGAHPVGTGVGAAAGGATGAASDDVAPGACVSVGAWAMAVEVAASVNARMSEMCGAFMVRHIDRWPARLPRIVHWRHRAGAALTGCPCSRQP